MAKTKKEIIAKAIKDGAGFKEVNGKNRVIGPEPKDINKKLFVEYRKAKAALRRPDSVK